MFSYAFWAGKTKQISRPITMWANINALLRYALSKTSFNMHIPYPLYALSICDWIGHRWIHVAKIMWTFFFVVSLNWMLNKSMLSVIWEAMKLIWRHCNGVYQPNDFLHWQHEFVAVLNQPPVDWHLQTTLPANLYAANDKYIPACLLPWCCINRDAVRW